MLNRAVAILEIMAFLALLYFSKRFLDPVIWRFSGPVSLVFTLVIVTLYLQVRGQSWRQYGLVRLEGTKDKLMVVPQALLVFAVFAAALAPVLIFGPKLGLTFLEEIPAGVEDRWGDVKGNLKLYLLWLFIVWTAAAFGEEMFFRGFLITKLEQVFKGFWLAAPLAVLLSASYFGFAHVYYQGMRGLVITGIIGIVFGMMFLLFKRNLWPIILFHGVIDTLTFTKTYFDWQ